MVEYEQVRVHLTDPQFSTLVVMELTGRGSTLVEYIEYDAHGHARHIPRAEADGDVIAGTSDQQLVLNEWGNDGSNGGDIYRDGTVGLGDLLAVMGGLGHGVAIGQLSASESVVGTRLNSLRARFLRFLDSDG